MKATMRRDRLRVLLEKIQSICGKQRDDRGARAEDRGRGKLDQYSKRTCCNISFIAARTRIGTEKKLDDVEKDRTVMIGA